MRGLLLPKGSVFGLSPVSVEVSLHPTRCCSQSLLAAEDFAEQRIFVLFSQLIKLNFFFLPATSFSSYFFWVFFLGHDPPVTFLFFSFFFFFFQP